MILEKEEYGKGIGVPGVGRGEEIVSPLLGFLRTNGNGISTKLPMTQSDVDELDSR